MEFIVSVVSKRLLYWQFNINLGDKKKDTLKMTPRFGSLGGTINRET